MEQELKLAVSKFIISYAKLYADELRFMAEVIKNNLEAFDTPESLIDSFMYIAEDLESALDTNFTTEILDNTDKAHFVVTIDDNA